MWNALRKAVWKWILKKLRGIVWVADEWIHAQEVKLQVTGTSAQAPDPAVDPVASAAREKVFRSKPARAARPRLRYQGGQFVRV
jgi:hypothetical protein